MSLVFRSILWLALCAAAVFTELAVIHILPAPFSLISFPALGMTTLIFFEKIRATITGAILYGLIAELFRSQPFGATLLALAGTLTLLIVISRLLITNRTVYAFGALSIAALAGYPFFMWFGGHAAAFFHGAQYVSITALTVSQFASFFFVNLIAFFCIYGVIAFRNERR